MSDSTTCDKCGKSALDDDDDIETWFRITPRSGKIAAAYVDACCVECACDLVASTDAERIAIEDERASGRVRVDP